MARDQRDAESLARTARKFVSKFYRRVPDREQVMADIGSVAWEIGLRAPEHVTNSALIHFAARRIEINRQFQESIRCVLTIPKDKRASRAEFRRVAFNPGDLTSRRDDPAEIASFRIDYPAWLASLDERKRTIVAMLAVGETNGAVARRLGVSPAAVTQAGRKLHADWIAKHS